MAMHLNSVRITFLPNCKYNTKNIIIVLLLVLSSVLAVILVMVVVVLQQYLQEQFQLLLLDYALHILVHLLFSCADSVIGTCKC
jgi:hypothetical protein